jgi:hypothetical protein
MAFLGKLSKIIGNSRTSSALVPACLLSTKSRKHGQEERPKMLGGTLTPRRVRIVACLALQSVQKDSPMYILRARFFVVSCSGRPRSGTHSDPSDPKLTPGDTFDVTTQDVCVAGYAKKVRAVPAWPKRQACAKYKIAQYKTGDYEVDHLIPLSPGGIQFHS